MGTGCGAQRGPCSPSRSGVTDRGSPRTQDLLPGGGGGGGGGWGGGARRPEGQSRLCRRPHPAPRTPHPAGRAAPRLPVPGGAGGTWGCQATCRQRCVCVGAPPAPTGHRAGGFGWGRALGVRPHVCECVFKHVCICVCMYIHTHMCTHKYMHARICVRMCVTVCMCMYVYACMSVNTCVCVCVN